MAIDAVADARARVPRRGRRRHPDRRPAPEVAAAEHRLGDGRRRSVGYLFGHWLGNVIASGYTASQNSGQNDVATVLALVFGVVGWLAGIGALNYPLAKLLGREPAPAPPERPGSRYFRMTDDHKVVGLQYTVGVLLFFFTGGLFAMADPHRAAEPDQPRLRARHLHRDRLRARHDHDDDGVLGRRRPARQLARAAHDRLAPHGVPSRRGLLVLDLRGRLPRHPDRPVPRRLPDRLDGLRPAADPGGGGHGRLPRRLRRHRHRHDRAGFNLAATIINYRAPGHDLEPGADLRLGILATCALLTLATPDAGRGRAVRRSSTARPQTAFFVNEHGGSNFLWQNLFWFFGHPEVYIMALPGFGIVMEIMPVFTRKPLFAYKIAAAGMIGVALLSFFVWQHHLFQSGINPDMRPLFMLTTELISIPTGFLFLVTLGTLWKAKIRFEPPMLFCLGMLFNFLIGGITGVFLSDVPVNVTVHGSFFVMAHFHYTIMGGLIFAFFGGLYYWLPKMTGKTHEPQAQHVALLDVVHLLQPDVLPALLRRASWASPGGSSSTRRTSRR